jgi:hypothetical protein
VNNTTTLIALPCAQSTQYLQDDAADQKPSGPVESELDAELAQLKAKAGKQDLQSCATNTKVPLPSCVLMTAYACRD